MSSLRDIKRRITSVKSTQQITKAMKMVAAAKLRRAQERIFEARPYSNKMHDVLQSLALRADPSAHPLLARREPKKVQVMIISSDKGLCGGFNTNIMRRSIEFLRQLSEDEIALTLMVVGRKVRDYYKRRPYAISQEYVNIMGSLGYKHAQDMAQKIINDYLEEVYDEVYLIYNEFKSIVSQRVVVNRLLPLSPPETSEEAPVVDFIYEPSEAAIMNELLPKHFETQIYRALLESVAAEFGARMTAMDNATKNASEMIDMLTLSYNRARQEKITKELLEIVSGAEALKG